MLKLQTILHPTDFSPRSEQAFEMACSLARDHGAGIILLHVIELPITVQGGVMTPPAPEPVEDKREAQEKLRRISAAAANLKVEPRLEVGDSPSVILNVAKESKCDLIVMGTHGRTGIARFLMGSVAEMVLRKAPCPVLTLKSTK
jgi:nucleotide-binding universal stress UspA family protein